MLGLREEASVEEGLLRYVVTGISVIGSEASGASRSGSCSASERRAVSKRPVGFSKIALVGSGSTAIWNSHYGGNLKDLGLAVRNKP